jgi:archaeosine synthase alpha-subunit
MTRVSFRKRDGLARAGVLEPGGLPSISLPAVAECEKLYPALTTLAGTNLPLCAPKAIVNQFPPEAGTQPVSIHPQLDNRAQSGDCVIVSGWHIAMANPRTYVDWLIGLKEKTPPDTAWYAPASALPSTVAILCYSGFDLFDYTAVDLRSAQGRFCTPEGDFPKGAFMSGICSCPGCAAGNLQEHNRYALRQEIALVTLFIRQGRVHDLVESRCRQDAAQVAIMRHLDQKYAFMERVQPVARAGIMRANSGESLQRAEVRRFAERVIGRYIPPKTDVAVLLPCSARKPYSLSQSHRKFQQAVGGRAHELIVTSPLGLVPRELETVYPAGHYDVPVTGYWDAEERAVIADILARYFQKHSYRRIIAHLEGGALEVAQMAAGQCGIPLEYSCTEHPVGNTALNALDAALAGERKIRDDRLHGMISYQFNCDVDTKGTTLRGHFPEVFYSRNNVQLFSIDTGTGMLRPTLDGWKIIPDGYRVHIDDFIPEGDILTPGVVSADPAIRDGDEVLVVGPRALGTGRAALPADEMQRSRRGIAVHVRKIKRI